MGNQICIGTDFYILLKLTWYQFRLDCYKFRILKETPWETLEKHLKIIQKRIWKGNQNGAIHTHRTKQLDTKGGSTGGNGKPEGIKDT